MRWVSLSLYLSYGPGVDPALIVSEVQIGEIVEKVGKVICAVGRRRS